MRLSATDWQWSWVLCDEDGEPLPGAHVGRGRRLVFARNQEAEARITLSLHDEAAIRLFEVLRNGIPQLRVYLHIPDDQEARAVGLPSDGLVFSGLWTPMNGGDGVGEQSYVNLVFKDAFHILRWRYVYIESDIFEDVDAGLIAEDLIATTNLVFGSTTVATDTDWIEATKARDRTYEYKIIADAITELTEVVDGFDWYPVYLDPRDNDGDTMQFWIVAERGDDRAAARFEFGDGTLGNCKRYQFTGSLPVNAVVTLGAASGLGPYVAGASDAASIARYRRYIQIVAATDVSEEGTLIDKATDALRPDVGLVTQFTGDPAKCPLPWRDFWIGDTIRWNVDDGAMQERTSPRVQTIEVSLDDSDNIEDLVVGIDPEASGSYLAPLNTTRRYVQQQRDLRRRLSDIERRVGL